MGAGHVRVTTVMAAVASAVTCAALAAPGLARAATAVAPSAADTAADTPALTTTLSATPAEQSLATALTFAGTAAARGTSVLHALVRTAGVAPCAATYGADVRAHATLDDVLVPGSAQAPGPFSATVSWTPAATGAYLVCAWLSRPAGPGAVGPVSTPVSVRGPQVPVLTVVPSASPSEGQSFELRYTTQSDQPLKLTSIIRPGGGGCAADQSADVAADPADHILFPGGIAVDGGPAVATTALHEPAGDYLVCTWVVGPLAGEVDAAVATPLVIAAPPPPQASNLTLGRLVASIRSGVRFTGTAARGLAGRVDVHARCDRRHGSTTATVGVRDGRFSGRLPLPRGCHAGATLILGARWPGSTTFATSHAVRTVRVSAPSRRGPRLPRLFSRIAHRHGRFHDLFTVRPRTILIGSTQLTLRWTRWTRRAAVATGVARPAHGHRYPVTVRADHAIAATFACLRVTRGTGTGDGGRARVARYGLGRLGHSTFAWLAVGWLHRRASGARPWPRPGCPAG